MAYRRSRGPKGRKCIRRKCVKVRCAKFGPKRSGGKYRRRMPAGMSRKGSKCVAYKRVRVRGQGTALRCIRYRRRRR